MSQVPWWVAVAGMFVIFAISLLPAILYILTLQRTLSKCEPGSRTIEPGTVWLLLVPLVNIIFHFFVVLGLAKTLRNEFNRRGIPVADPTPGQTIGMVMCIATCCCFIPFLNFLAILVELVCWLCFWVKIAEFSNALDTQPHAYMGTPIV